MSVPPISGPEAETAPADVQWLELQRGGAEEQARALMLARLHFGPHDPRLATSLVAHARHLDQEAARPLFEEALAIWREVRTAVSVAPAPRLARSSLFHLRLEAKHPGAYVDGAQRRRLERLDEAMVLTRALADGAPALPPLAPAATLVDPLEAALACLPRTA